MYITTLERREKIERDTRIGQREVDTGRNGLKKIIMCINTNL